jgi:hypothetical protein
MLRHGGLNIQRRKVQQLYALNARMRINQAHYSAINAEPNSIMLVPLAVRTIMEIHYFVVNAA